MRAEAKKYFERIDELGGMLAAIDKNFFRREIADAAFAYQRDVDAKRKLIVGVNAFVEKEAKPLETLMIDDSVEHEQLARLAAIKARREPAAAACCLDRIRRLVCTKQKLLPA